MSAYSDIKCGKRYSSSLQRVPCMYVGFTYHYYSSITTHRTEKAAEIDGLTEPQRYIIIYYSVSAASSMYISVYVSAAVL